MSLLDHYLPAFQFRERHACTVSADTAAVLDAVTIYRPENDGLFRFFIGLRELPMRLASKEGQQRPTFGFDNFTLLQRSDDEIVYGLHGAFWKPDFGLQQIQGGEAFRANGAPGCAKLVLGFVVQPESGGKKSLVTETRVFCPDAATRNRFAPYWYLIRPVSGLIRRRMLASIKVASDKASGGEALH